MKYRVGLPALLLGAAALSLAQGQPQDPAPPTKPTPEVSAPAPTKVATIFAQNAIASTLEGQKAGAALSAKYEPQRKEFDRKQAELQTLRDQLKRGMATMSADARDKLNQTIDAKSTELRRLSEDIQSQMEEEEANIMQQLGDKLLKVIDTYARDHGLAVVLDVSNRPSPVIWAYPMIDITNDIVRLYDKAYPVAAPPPAAPPPAKK